jgi:hypothetical protein
MKFGNMVAIHLGARWNNDGVTVPTTTIIPAGTIPAAFRPSSQAAINGMARFSSTNNALRIYINTDGSISSDTTTGATNVTIFVVGSGVYLI